MPPASKDRKPRIPKLSFTTIQNIGWHVSYRDPDSGTPKKHKLGITDHEKEAEALVLYHAWVAKHLGGDTGLPTAVPPPPPKPRNPNILTGSLLEVGSSLRASEEARVRKEGEPRRRGTIDPRVLSDRKNHIRDFLTFLNTRHGPGAVSRLSLSDLTMEDVEQYNRHIVSQNYSASQVAKRMQIVRAIIDRAGRPEHGLQVLAWNWDSRDTAHGIPTEERMLPTKKQLIKLLQAADARGKLMIWLGIGLGFGARDLSAIQVGQISRDAYDLRRGKTGIDRYGVTPRLVWTLVKDYEKAATRQPGELLLRTRTGRPLVHGATDAVSQWWNKLRVEIGETQDTLSGFYSLRHLGATEFGSRPGTSIGEVKRWLGHSASSNVADLYMRPVRPEYREVVEWVRETLQADKLVLPRK